MLYLSIGSEYPKFSRVSIRRNTLFLRLFDKIESLLGLVGGLFGEEYALFSLRGASTIFVNFCTDAIFKK